MGWRVTTMNGKVVVTKADDEAPVKPPPAKIGAPSPAKQPEPVAEKPDEKAKRPAAAPKPKADDD